MSLVSCNKLVVFADAGEDDGDDSMDDVEEAVSAEMDPCISTNKLR